MQRNNAERMMDIIIGEAVATMLDGDDAISVEALARQLRAMMLTESDPERLMALQRALAEVQAVRSPAPDRQSASVHGPTARLRPGDNKH